MPFWNISLNYFYNKQGCVCQLLFLFIEANVHHFKYFHPLIPASTVVVTENQEYFCFSTCGIFLLSREIHTDRSCFFLFRISYAIRDPKLNWSTTLSFQVFHPYISCYFNLLFQSSSSLYGWILSFLGWREEGAVYLPVRLWPLRQPLSSLRPTLPNSTWISAEWFLKYYNKYLKYGVQLFRNI